MKHADVIAKLSLREKCALLSGATVFETHALPNKGVPAIWLSDGPNGLRKQAGPADHLGLNPAEPATCFPTAATVANSWDPALGEDAMGLGMARMDTLTTPLVYLADDGRSARYLGYRLGFQAAGKPDGDADCYLDFGLVFADLLKEDGAWKLWHLVLEHDHTVTVGEHYEDLPVLRDQYTDPLEEQNGTPTIQTPVYQPLFGWEYMWQDMPKPYYTYSETESYGPGGNLGKPYYERERR